MASLFKSEKTSPVLQVDGQTDATVQHQGPNRNLPRTISATDTTHHTDMLSLDDARQVARAPLPKSKALF